MLLVREFLQLYNKGRRGFGRMCLDLQLPLESVLITTNVVSSNLD